MKREDKYVLYGISAGLLFLYFTKDFWRNKLINPLMAAVWDLISEKRIATLHPDIQDDARGFINTVEKELGVKLLVAQALRIPNEQNDLYAQGRTKAGKIVTNAKAFESYHNYGLAFDVVRMVDGKADWTPVDAKIAAIAKRFGFAWGGEWKFKDYPHFEKNYGYGSNPLRSGLNKKIPSGSYYPTL